MNFQHGRFNMETLVANGIFTPKHPFTANRYWLGLVGLHWTVDDELPSKRYRQLSFIRMGFAFMKPDAIWVPTLFPF